MLSQDDGWADFSKCLLNEPNAGPIMERLDQGQLHPSLEVPTLTCFLRGPNPGLNGGMGGGNSSEKLFEERINSYSICNICSTRGSRQCMWLHKL